MSCPVGYGGGDDDKKKKNENKRSFEEEESCPVGTPPKGCGCPMEGVDLSKPDSQKREGQSLDLDNSPVPSKIPKSGSEGTWIYPSPQRFYNALKKKGWSPEEEAVPSVVKIHNMVNEECWRRVMEYEKLHESTCPDPKLLKFRGRPGDFTPKSRLWSFVGYSLPFDRHDWVVDRCGKEVEYVIDFYQGHPSSAVPVAIHLDVRPKLTPGGAMDRMRMFYKKNF